MFDYIKGCILDELKRIFTFSYNIHSYTTRSSEVFHIPKRNTTSFDGVKLKEHVLFSTAK